MIRIVADSNIYISALISGRGKPAELIELARTGVIRLLVSEAILDEVAEVLERKFKRPPEDIAEIKREIEGFAQKIRPSVALDVVKEDPDDDRILECASSGGADYIVSGDKDLLRLGQYDAMPIMTVADFLARGRQR